MPKSPSKPKPRRRPAPADLDSLIDSAAGAIMRAEGMELVLDAPDEVVCAKLKKETKWLRSKLKLDRKLPKGEPTDQSA